MDEFEGWDAEGDSIATVGRADPLLYSNKNVHQLVRLCETLFATNRNATLSIFFSLLSDSRYWDRFVRSFDTKTAPRISRKPFDLESPNFTKTSTLILSTVTLDMTSLFTSSRKLQGKNSRKYRHRRLRAKFIEKGSSYDHEIVHTYRGQRAPQHAGNYTTSCYFRSEFIDVRKTAENAASDGFVCIKYNALLHYAVSKASSNFSIEEYRQHLRLKRRGVSPTPPYVGFLLINVPAFNRISLFVFGIACRRLPFGLVRAAFLPRCESVSRPSPRTRSE